MATRTKAKRLCVVKGCDNKQDGARCDYHRELQRIATAKRREQKKQERATRSSTSALKVFDEQLEQIKAENKAVTMQVQETCNYKNCKSIAVDGMKV